MNEQGWVYQDSDTKKWVYRASSTGSCLRSLVASRLGESSAPPNAGLKAAMLASSGLEDEIVRRVETELGDGKVIWQQKRVELEVPDLLAIPDVLAIVRGHIDGLHQQSDSIVEIKALGPANFKKYNEGGGLPALGTLGEKYAIQAAVYGHATGRKVRMVIGEKLKVDGQHQVGYVDEKGSLVCSCGMKLAGKEDYEQHMGAKGDLWEVGEVIIEPAVNPHFLFPLEAIYDRIRTIEDYASRDELPPCSAGCRPGDPYDEVHLFPGAAVGDEELEKLVQRREELKELLGAEPKKDKPGWGLLGELADVQDAIKTDYGNLTQTQKYTVGPFTVTITANKGRESIDTFWLRKNYPDIAAEATKLGQPFNTLTVKRMGSKEE